MLLLGSNPETLETWKTLYLRPKVLLVLLLFLLSPTYTPTSTTSPPAPSSYQVAPATTLDSDASSSAPVLPLTQLSDGNGSVSQADGLENSSTFRTEGAGDAAMRGYTSGAGDGENLTSTISISSPPSAASESPTPACTETDERGRLLCDREAKRISFEERLAEVEQEARVAVQSWEKSVLGFFTFSSQGEEEEGKNAEEKPKGFLKSRPWIVVVALLYAVMGCELIALAAEDEIVKRSFSNSPIPSFQRSSSLSKRISRAKFHILHSFKYNFRPLITLCFTLTIVILIAIQAWKESWISPPIGFEPPRGWGGLRYPKLGQIVIFFECITCLTTLSQPMKHLIPRSVMPKTISPPFYNSISRLSPSKKPTRNSPTTTVYNSRRTRRRPTYERTRGSTFFEGSDEKKRRRLTDPVGVVVEMKWAIGVGVEAVAVVAGLAQYLAVALTLRSFYPHSLSTLFTFLCLRSRVAHFRRVCGFYRKTVECLRLVLNSFPFFDGDDEEEDWRCSVCFEGAEREDEGLDGGQERWGGKRCRLDCGHVLHADCLITWLHFQSFCCVCTTPITRPPEEAVG
ncbi:hypothetical protein BT69DRAFT_396748 [Atractiella rhizophila]|nr:hypothetical protein BT69DRAFT_396748 [Atractiella rhizophila]